MTITRTRTSRTRSAAVALGLAAALGLSACSGEDAATTTETGSDGPVASASAEASEAVGDASESASAEPSASAEAEPVAQIDMLTGVDTSVALEQSFLDALTSLMVTPGTVGSAALDPATGTLTFPITGGDVTYYDPSSEVRPYVQGMIEHDGSGLSLTAGETVVELTDFVVDPGESVLTGTVTAGGEVAAQDANLFFLDGRTLEPLAVDEAAGTASLTGTQVKLHPDAAALLGETFATDGIPDFLLVGTATITVALPQG